MSKKERICRFCLKLPDDELIAVDEVTRQMFDFLQIQINFDLNENSVMCKDCSETIERLYAFKSLCVDTQDLITLSNVQQNKDNIDLRSIYKAKTDLTLDHDTGVCRLCMRASRVDGLFSIETLNTDNAFAEMWTKYMAEVEMNITRNPKVCFHCKENVQYYFKFAFDFEVILRYSDGLAEMCTFKTDVTEESTKNSHLDLDTKDESVKKLEPTATGNDHITIKSEVDIKEEPDGYEENQPCTSGNCDECGTQPHVTNYFVEDNDPSGIILYRCSRCHYRTRWKNAITRHLKRTHTTSDVYTCPQCSFTTKYKPNLKRHKVTHGSSTDIKTLECAGCNYKTKNKRSLERHTMSRHTDKSDLQLYKCFQCQYETCFKEYIKQHMLTHRNRAELPRYACAMCPYVANKRSALRSHSVVHKTDMLECEVCGFKTKHKQGLQRHKCVIVRYVPVVPDTEKA